MYAARELIATHIQDFGQHLVCVWPDDNSPADFRPFVYTIGNHEAGFPELLMLGHTDEFELYCTILNILGKLQRERGQAFHHG